MVTYPISIVPIPVYSDNYAWVIRNGFDAAVIDPGEADPIKRFIDRQSLRLSAILVTHHHADHCGGVAELKNIFGCPAIGAHDERMTFVDDAVHERASRMVAGLRMIA